MSDMFVYSGCEPVTPRFDTFERLKMLRAAISVRMNRDRRRVQPRALLFHPNLQELRHDTPRQILAVID
jgi:hypothetical protein